jgi:hypothetical protein
MALRVSRKPGPKSGTTLIVLTQGYQAIVDNEDVEFLSGFNWSVHEGKYTLYARAQVNGKRVYMHRLLKPGATTVDHVDGNGLNNTKENLRETTQSKNNLNTTKRKGVSYNSRYKKPWRARLHYGGKTVMEERFETEAEALQAYQTTKANLMESLG